jgi:glycerol-3-phosphate dehydrogenase
MTTRSETLRLSDSATYDLCVIGGGASGAGCALDAQLRGLRTVLIEGADFASRTSSASTKMAHGGIRYLQAAFANLDMRQYRLVSHAVRERALMLRNAPHLTATQEFLVPCFTRGEQFYYGAGLKMYDWIAGRASLARSRVLSFDQAVRRLPGLHHRGLLGAVSYADGQFDDSRYGLALVTTFVRAGGAALNYAKAVDFERADNGQIAALAVEDRITGGAFTVRARVFVNATGPFSDAVRRLASPGTESRLRPSKGVHLLFPLDAGWNGDGLLVPKTEDGRVVFALPYGGRLLVGTTDNAASPDAEMVITRQEIDYLIRQINPYLERPLHASDVVSGFAGIRPLVQSRNSMETSKLIRDDEVEVDARSGLISILGGKWTTYRLMAEKTVDRVQAALGLAVGGCVTRNTRLAGSEGYHSDYWRELMEGGLPEPTSRHLAHKFGTDAVHVLQLANEDDELASPLVDGAPPIQAEVVYAVRHEMALTVDDILARRTGLELYDWRMAIEAAPAVARLMGRELGWSPAEVRRASNEYIAKIDRLLKVAGLAEQLEKHSGLRPRV